MPLERERSGMGDGLSGVEEALMVAIGASSMDVGNAGHTKQYE